MRNTARQVPIWLKQHKLLSAVALLALICVGWWAVATYMPHPLGDKMEYLGKEDYGNIFGFDSFPASDYYYGTDMSVEDLNAYFHNAKVLPTDAGAAGAKIIEFKSNEGNFFIYHYWEKSVTPFKTDKKYIVSVGSASYATARDAIK